MFYGLSIQELVMGEFIGIMQVGYTIQQGFWFSLKEESKGFWLVVFQVNSHVVVGHILGFIMLVIGLIKFLALVKHFGGILTSYIG